VAASGKTDGGHLQERIIDLRQLRYFVQIVDFGSLSRAAAELHIAQSALSQHVASLEGDMKARLLQRSSRGVQPTESGHLLYQHAQLMLQQAAEARAAVQAASAAPTGEVRVGLPLSLVAALGMPVLAGVRAAFPAIHLQILEELSGTILEWVKNGRLAIGIAFDDGNLDGLHTIPLLEERLFLVTAPKSPHARRKSVPLRELANLVFVLPTKGQGVRGRVDRALTEARLGAARVAAEVDSHTLLKQAAASGMGATILSWTSVEAEVGRGELVAVEIVRPAITRTAHVCVQSAAPPTRATLCARSALVEAVRRAVQRPSWRGVRYLGPADAIGISDRTI
jgi:LysR family nitrogen assimilation transcriptional regulator